MKILWCTHSNMFVCMKLLAQLSALCRSVCNLELLVSCNKRNKFQTCVVNDIVTVSCCVVMFSDTLSLRCVGYERTHVSPLKMLSTWSVSRNAFFAIWHRPELDSGQCTPDYITWTNDDINNTYIILTENVCIHRFNEIRNPKIAFV